MLCCISVQFQFEMVVLKVLREFAGGTSIHGFTFVVSPKSSSRTKIIWAIAIVVALSYASWEMKNSVFSKYHYVFRTMKYKQMSIITYVQIYLLKFEFELLFYEKVAHICLIINKNVRFLLTAYPYTAYLVRNPFIYRSKMDLNHKQISLVCPIQF